MSKRFLYILIMLMGIAGAATAQQMTELNKRLKKAQEEIAYIDRLQKKNTADKRNNLQQLELTQTKIKTRKQMLADMDAQIHLLENDLGKKQDNVAELKTTLDELKKSYEQLLYQAYKNRDQRLWLMFILSSNDAGLAYRRWQYFKNYSEYINDQAIKIRQTSQKLRTEIITLSEKREDLARHRRVREQEVTALQRDEAEAQEMSRKLATQEKDLARQMAEQRKTIERINRQIEQIVADQARKDAERARQAAKQQGVATPELPVVDMVLSGKFESNRGQLPWPVSNGIITGKFGIHYHPVYKNIELPPNNGIDITTDANSIIRCVFEGEVKQIFVVPGRHTCVLVQHGAYYTLYCQLASVSVKVGDKLYTGQPLGIVYTTDSAVMHFEIWKGTNKTDPELWLKKW